ncbi:sucrose nonfermenting 4-like protein [Musa acuminata AAA Group]|uniref:sucrose nonfermenting 4-like protein n=1 Tax=Musa acuminata AAA Group TaxID=214697 RepID=UPI0031DAF2E3
MFSSRTDCTHDTAGISGQVLIATKFVWPYGGRTVSLIGSFTGWTDRYPMFPVEGCPNIFQAVYSLTPGIHQYKFFVDGEWRHDDQQPHVVGNYGIVNTLILPQESNPILTALGLEKPSNRINMDVDNWNFRHVETTLRVPEADIGRFRDHIFELLSTRTAYELLPDSGKVIALDSNLPVKQAFHILYEQGIPVAPLLDTYKGEFVGVLSPLDFILILKALSNHGSNLAEEELESHTISAWKEAKQHLSRQIVMHQRQSQRQLIHAEPYDSLKDVALKILQNQVATVPIISSRGESFPHLLYLASLSEIMKCICRHFRHSSVSLPILQQAICTIPVGTWIQRIGESNGKHLAMLRPNESLSSALALLVQAQVSSIPIIDDHDCLLDAYSRSDITSLAKDNAYARIHLDDMRIYQALQLRQESNSHYGFYKGQRCQMCLHSDSLQKVMEQLANPGVRRLFVVEAGSNRVEGIISLSDVFRFFFSLA